MSPERHSHIIREDSHINLSQSREARIAIWEDVGATSVNEAGMKIQFEEKGYCSLPEGTIAMLRIGYQTSPTAVEYFDIGAIRVGSGMEVAMIKSKRHALADTLTFTLDSKVRRDLYESGEGREALEVEKSLAREFMKDRRDLLNQPNIGLRLGSITQVQLLTRADNL